MSHVLHTVVVSYNRTELLERTIASYCETVTLPHSLWIIDNRSQRATMNWIVENRHRYGYRYLLLGKNFYPGFAANKGFGRCGKATLLHRSDNDMEYLPGWCDEVVRMFSEDDRLGQLGLRTVEEEGPVNAVGGNAVFRREVWDAGARYDERPWQECKFEDGEMSNMMQALGYRWDRVKVPCTVHIGIASSKDPYYQKTFADRGITFAEWGVE